MKEKDVIIADVPKVFIQANMLSLMMGQEHVIIRITGILVDMLIALYPEAYGNMLLARLKTSSLRTSLKCIIWHINCSDVMLQEVSKSPWDSRFLLNRMTNDWQTTLSKRNNGQFDSMQTTSCPAQGQESEWAIQGMVTKRIWLTSKSKTNPMGTTRVLRNAHGLVRESKALYRNGKVCEGHAWDISVQDKSKYKDQNTCYGWIAFFW